MNTNYNFGRELLDGYYDLELSLHRADRAEIISLIEACIDDGWTRERQILEKFYQIGGPYEQTEVLELLSIHGSPAARSQRWERMSDGQYRLLDHEGPSASDRVIHLNDVAYPQECYHR